MSSTLPIAFTSAMTPAISPVTRLQLKSLLQFQRPQYQEDPPVARVMAPTPTNAPTPAAKTAAFFQKVLSVSVVFV